jgi:hypothetical protein
MKHFLAIVPVTILGVALIGCETPPTEIADVSVATTLPNQVGAGDYEKTFAADGMATGVFFKATLSDCSAEVAAVGRAWAEQNRLTPSPATPQPGVTTLLFTSDRFPDGMFIIRYTMNPERATVHITHQVTGGGKPRPTTEFGELGMVALIDNLVNAAQCDANGHALKGTGL